MEINTLEYSQVKATAVSMRLRIYWFALKNQQAFLALLLGNGGYSRIVPSLSMYPFFLLPHHMHLTSTIPTT
jgi:hypothetical protein